MDLSTRRFYNTYNLVLNFKVKLKYLLLEHGQIMT